MVEDELALIFVGLSVKDRYKEKIVKKVCEVLNEIDNIGKSRRYPIDSLIFFQIENSVKSKKDSGKLKKGVSMSLSFEEVLLEVEREHQFDKCHNKGLEQGMEQSTDRIVLNMLDASFDDEKILEITECSENHFFELKMKHLAKLAIHMTKNINKISAQSEFEYCYNKGFKKGVKEGMKTTMHRTALEMVRHNIDDVKIQKCTHCSSEFILELKRKYHPRNNIYNRKSKSVEDVYQFIFDFEREYQYDNGYEKGFEERTNFLTDKIILRMLHHSIDDEEIQRCTGCSSEHLRKLKLKNICN